MRSPWLDGVLKSVGAACERERPRLVDMVIWGGLGLVLAALVALRQSMVPAAPPGSVVVSYDPLVETVGNLMCLGGLVLFAPLFVGLVVSLVRWWLAVDDDWFSDPSPGWWLERCMFDRSYAVSYHATLAEAEHAMHDAYQRLEATGGYRVAYRYGPVDSGYANLTTTRPVRPSEGVAP